jgi:hypothetical protein
MRDTDAERWFARGLNLFAFALPLAIAFVAFAPVGFVRLLGAIALVASALGMATSLAGLRLAAPRRWRVLRRAVHRVLPRLRWRGPH